MIHGSTYWIELNIDATTEAHLEIETKKQSMQIPLQRLDCILWQYFFNEAGHLVNISDWSRDLRRPL